MKLLTAAIVKKLDKARLYSTENRDVAPVIVKFFVPWNGWTWYAIEGKEEDGDWIFFGLVEGQERELGYFRLSDLQSVVGPGGLRIERDRYFDGYSLDKSKMEVVR